MPEKQLPRKANSRNFLQINCSNFKLKQCERSQSYENLKQIRFKDFWNELESKTCFQKQ